MLRSSFLSYSIAAIAIAGAASAQVQPAVACQPGWANIFAGSQGLDGTVQAMTVFDDGSGPALFVAGGFANAGSVSSSKPEKSRSRCTGMCWRCSVECRISRSRNC